MKKRREIKTRKGKRIKKGKITLKDWPNKSQITRWKSKKEGKRTKGRKSMKNENKD